MKKVFSFCLVLMMLALGAASAFARSPVTEFSLGADVSTGTELEGALLTPGKSYKFPIIVTINGKEQPLDEDIFAAYKMKFDNNGEGESISVFDLTRSDGIYYLKVVPKAGWPAASTDESRRIKLVRKNGSSDDIIISVSFSTGYPEADDDAIASLQKGDEVVVDALRPIYSAQQLAYLRDTYDSDRLIFSGRGWRYAANISAADSLNLLYNASDVDEIIEKFPEHQFMFLTFPAGPKFLASGSLDIDVSDYAQDFGEKFYVYRYLHGRLSPISAQYDAFAENLSFKTDALGRFVITDKTIEELLVFGSTDSSPQTEHPDNPQTGAAA